MPLLIYNPFTSAPRGKALPPTLFKTKLERNISEELVCIHRTTKMNICKAEKCKVSWV